MGIALKVENVSIRYITGDFKDIGLKEYVVRKLKHNYHVNEFFAVSNVSFELEEGDMLGIVGTNGAGKSTLLKAVSGIMEPTRGRIIANGDVAALLELGSGFDDELTVRENAYLRGAMLGYTKEFMDSTYNQIIDFAELWDFQDRPFKQLSSGMKSRLAFSIASLVKPDILILDEVLSVGDGAFQKKSAEKMREIIGQGATTILVSHSLSQIRELCNKILWLDHGKQIAFGDAEEICNLYEKYLHGEIGLPQPPQEHCHHEETEEKRERPMPALQKRLGLRVIVACLIAALFFGSLTASIVLQFLPVQQEVLTATISAKPDTGTVTFRGASVDGAWLRPADMVSSNDGWIFEEQENTYTATGEGLLTVQLSAGTKRELVFDVGPDQGTAVVCVGDKTLEFTMTENVDWDQGWSYEIPGYVDGSAQVGPYIAAGASLLYLVMFLLLCGKFGAAKVADLSNQRELWGDLLRGVCSFVVLLLHASCNVFGDFSGGIRGWLPHLILNSFTAFAVPCFYMLSGAYLLRREHPIARTLKNRVLKSYIPLLAWGVLYLLFRGNRDVSAYGRLLYTNQEAHLWFMYSILSIYILLPFISKIYGQMGTKAKVYALVILLVIPTALYELQHLTGIYINRPNFAVMWPDLGLFILGGFLWEKREWLCARKKLFAVSFPAGLLLTVSMTLFVTLRDGAPNKAFISCIGSTGAVLMAVSAIVIAMSLESRLQKSGPILQTVILITGGISFSVYLAHIAVMDMMTRNPILSPFLFSNRGNVLQMFLSALVFYVVTSSVCWGGKKIPGISTFF